MVVTWYVWVAVVAEESSDWCSEVISWRRSAIWSAACWPPRCRSRQPQPSVVDLQPITHTKFWFFKIQSPEFSRASYKAPRAEFDSPIQYTHLSYAAAILDHPINTVVEFPETGRFEGKAVAHRFCVDASKLISPRENIQYSLGDEHYGKHNVECQLLKDRETGMALCCHKLTYICKTSSSIDFKNINSAGLGCGVKSCEFASEKTHTNGTFSTTNERAGSWNAHCEVFYKTLSLFTALRERGCSFRSEIHTKSDSDNSTDSCDSTNSTTALLLC